MKTTDALSVASRFYTAVQGVKGFIGASQLAALRDGVMGEEAEFFFAKLDEYGARIKCMPTEYGTTDKSKEEAVAYLHYFKGGMDFYITEKDSNQDGEGQVQAFGSADLGYGAELGYISIKELIENGVELDLYFNPTKLRHLDLGVEAD